MQNKHVLLLQHGLAYTDWYSKSSMKVILSISFTMLYTFSQADSWWTYIIVQYKLYCLATSAQLGLHCLTQQKVNGYYLINVIYYGVQVFLKRKPHHFCEWRNKVPPAIINIHIVVKRRKGYPHTNENQRAHPLQHLHTLPFMRRCSMPSSKKQNHGDRSGNSGCRGPPTQLQPSALTSLPSQLPGSRL